MCFSFMQELRCWSSVGASFNDASTLAVGSVGVPIHALHVSAAFDGVVIVFADGSVAACSADETGLPATLPPVASGLNKQPAANATPSRGKRGRTTVESSTAASSSVVWSEFLFEKKHGTSRVALATRSGEIVSFKLPNEGSKSTSGVTLLPERVGAASFVRIDGITGTRPAACCFQWPTSLYTLWSDGALTSSEIGRGATDFSGTGGLKCVTLVVVAALRVPPSDKFPSGLAMASINSGHVLMAGSASADGRPLALLWDTRYGTLQGEASVDAGGDAGGGSRAVVAAVRTGASGVTVALRSLVSTLPLEESVALASGGSLAAAIGASQATRKVVSASWAAAAYTPALTHTLQWPAAGAADDSWAAETAATDAGLARLGSALADQKATPTEAKFTEMLKEYLVASAKAHCPGGSPHVASAVILRFAGPASDTARAAGSAGKASAKSEKFFPEAALVQLLQFGGLSHVGCPGLLDAALVDGRTDLLGACIRHLGGLDEDSYIRGLLTLVQRVGGSSGAVAALRDKVAGANEQPVLMYLRLGVMRSWSEPAPARKNKERAPACAP